MDVKDIYALVADDMQAVELELQNRVQSEDVALIPTIGHYVLKSGGKRFRPLTLVLAARACGYGGSDHVMVGCILEFFRHLPQSPIGEQRPNQLAI